MEWGDYALMGSWEDSMRAGHVNASWRPDMESYMSALSSVAAVSLLVTGSSMDIAWDEAGEDAPRLKWNSRLQTPLELPRTHISDGM